MKNKLHQNAEDYYGKQIQNSQDLKTSACCSIESIPANHRKLLGNIDDEILSKFYGCGSPIPPAIEGLTVLDLGCGTGRDVYLASQLVGENGFVYGVDMTDEQLAVAEKHLDSHMNKFGFSKANVSFRKGQIEELQSAGIEDESIDLVISNCVVNLSPHKDEVLKEIFRALKPGGELYFSDVFASRRIPKELQIDPVLHGECLSGALYDEDFRRLLAELNCPDYRVFSSRKLEIHDPEISAKLANIQFYSRTIRAFKLPSLEDRCEDYGQVVTYHGNMKESPHAFILDDHHRFEVGKAETVCGNTAAMLEETRFNKYFKVDGNRSVHYGLFQCKAPDANDHNSGACC